MEMSEDTPADWLKPAVHPVYARLICAELRRQGFTEAEILQGTRLDWATLHDGNLFMSFEHTRRLIVRAQALAGGPWLGLLVGNSTQVSAHGALGYAGMAASNVAQVLGLLQRFLEMRQRVARFDVDTTHGLTLTMTELLSSPEVRKYLVGHLAAGITRVLETVTGQDVRAQVTVHWPFAEPAGAAHYRRFFPHSEFGSAQLRIDLPPQLLQCPGLASDPEAYRTALRDCERQLAQQQLGTVASRVQQRLLDAQGHYPSLVEMAELEHMSSRTLIRHLRDEGMTYQRLLDSVREELACWQLVHTTRSIEAIADSLGYQDTSNFSRTFRRWVGMTPKAFRDARVEALSTD